MGLELAAELLTCMHINLPLKDELRGIGLDCQMYSPLVEIIVQNAVFVIPPPTVFLSKWLRRAGVA